MSALSQKRTSHAWFETKEAANRGGRANLLVRWALNGQDAECCVLVALGDWLVLSWPACPP